MMNDKRGSPVAVFVLIFFLLSFVPLPSPIEAARTARHELTSSSSRQQHTQYSTSKITTTTTHSSKSPKARQHIRIAQNTLIKHHPTSPVMIERAARTEVDMGTHVMLSASAIEALNALGTVAVSADASAEQELILQDPGVKSALAAKTPDAVDKLIQGILDGTGQGGVVTSEFNQNGVHATIISNVNELRITQIENDAEERNKAAAESERKNAIVLKANQAAKVSELKEQTRSKP